MREKKEREKKRKKEKKKEKREKKKENVDIQSAKTVLGRQNLRRRREIF